MATPDAKVRLALYHPSLIAGGIQRVFVNLAQGFVERGFAVDMVQATPEGGFRHAVPEGVRLIDLNARRALTSLPGLVRYLRQERPQVLISGAIQTNLVSVWARRIARIPVRLILTEHNIISTITAGAPMLRTRMTPFLVRSVYPGADELVAVSQGAAQDLANTLGPCGRKVRVIYNPVVSREFWQQAAEPLNDPRLDGGHKPVILAVGRLHYHKDYPTLLRAFAILRRRLDAHLVFLGDGEERGRLEALARELQVETAVSFLGAVANPLPYMKHAKVLALSSMVEALPTVVIEALAMNLPVVATDCPTGPREILCEGAYGTLVPVGDSSTMADALFEVLSGRLVTVNSKDALERFQDDRVIEQYMAIMGINIPVPVKPESRQSGAPR
jgi:glycosyltransferase involved in cell wall biosynthesis